MKCNAALASVAALLLFAGCSSGDAETPQPQTKVAALGTPDPQVIQDVVDSVLMLPGESQRRAIRLSNFVRGLTLQACGGEPIPLDSTSDRYMQQTFPDLELIAERGLSEPFIDSGGSLNCDIRSSGVEAQLPSRVDAMELIQPWLDRVASIQQEPQILALKEPMYRCLTEVTSLEMGRDVPTAFLMASNLALSDDAGDRTDEMELFSQAYATCAKNYFDALKMRLAEERPTEVERNRELLTRYAAELVAVGYLP